MIQKDLFEFSYYLPRSDGMAFDPVFLGPASDVAENIILTGRRPSSTNFVDALDVLENGDVLFYGYILIIVYLVLFIGLICFCFVTNPTMNQAINEASSLTFKIYGIFVDQEDFFSTLWSQMVLWLFFAFGIFVLVFGYLFNLISTDLTVIITPRMIEGLDEQLSTEFANVKPHLVKNFNLYNVLMAEKKGTMLNQLFKLLQQDPANQMVALDMEGEGNFGELIVKLKPNIIDHFNASLLMPLMYLNMFVTPGLCQFDPKSGMSLHQSKGTLGGGTLHPPFNKLIDRNLMKYIAYRIQTVLEFQLYKQLSGRYSSSMVKRYTDKDMTQDGHLCKDRVIKKKEKENVIFELAALKQTWLVTGIGFVVSLISLIIESILAFKTKNKKKRNKLFKRRIKGSKIGIKQYSK